MFANALQQHIAKAFVKRHRWYSASVYRPCAKITHVYYKGAKPECMRRLFSTSSSERSTSELRRTLQ